MKSPILLLLLAALAMPLIGCAHHHADRHEDRYDRREDRYDRRTYSGPGDHVESRYDRIENRQDRLDRGSY